MTKYVEKMPSNTELRRRDSVRAASHCSHAQLDQSANVSLLARECFATPLIVNSFRHLRSCCRTRILYEEISQPARYDSFRNLSASGALPHFIALASQERFLP